MTPVWTQLHTGMGWSEGMTWVGSISPGTSPDWLKHEWDVEGWKLDSSAWIWKESRSLLFFIIFVSVLNFESLLIVDSYPAIRGDVSSLHDVSLTAAPLLGPALAAEGLHCWLNVTEVCFGRERGYESNLDCWHQTAHCNYFLNLILHRRWIWK